MVTVALAVNVVVKVYCKWVTETGTVTVTVIVSSCSGSVSGLTVSSKVVDPVLAPEERDMLVGAATVKSLVAPSSAVPAATVTVAVVASVGTDTSGGRAKLTVMVSMLSEPSSVTLAGETLRTAAGSARVTGTANSPCGKEELPPNRNSVRVAGSCDQSKDPKSKLLPDKSNLVKAGKSPIWAGTVPAIRFASTSTLGSTGTSLLTPPE